MSRTQLTYFLSLSSLILLIASYSNHFENDFHFDDSHTIVGNPHIRNIRNIPDYFFKPEMFSSLSSHSGLRPIVTTSLAIDYWIAGGLNPFYFHLSTFIWYIMLCVLLFFVYKTILKKTFEIDLAVYSALFMASWYSLHIANAETINYIIARSDVFSTLGVVASFLLFITYPQHRRNYLYVIPALLGVFAKETVLVLLILLFFYLLLFEKNLSIYDLFKANKFKTILSIVIELLPTFAILIIAQGYLLVKASVHPNTISNSTFYYILTQGYVWLRYFILFFLPVNFCADIGWNVIENVFDERIIIGLVFVFLLIIGIFKTSVRNETKPIAFGLIWFCSALLPTSLIPLSEVTNDHRMFFPFIGLVLSVGTSGYLFFSRYLLKMEKDSLLPAKVVLCLILVFVLGLNAYGVYQRNKVWKSEESLWLDVIKKSPKNGRGLMNYGLTQMAEGNYKAALSYFNKALQYIPSYSYLHINLGIIQTRMQQTKQAKESFERGIALQPTESSFYFWYGCFLKQNNQIREAKSIAEKGYQINSSNERLLHLLMSIYNEQSMWKELKEISEHSLLVLAEDKFAKVFLEASKKQTFVSEQINCMTDQVFSPDEYLNLSLRYYNEKEYEKSIQVCQQAIKLKPDYADAYNNMSAAYNQLGQWEKSIEAGSKALSIDPNHKLALGNINYASSRSRTLLFDNLDKTGDSKN